VFSLFLSLSAKKKSLSTFSAALILYIPQRYKNNGGERRKRGRSRRHRGGEYLDAKSVVFKENEKEKKKKDFIYFLPSSCASLSPTENFPPDVKLTYSLSLSLSLSLF
jgi:hypothetical protein